MGMLSWLPAGMAFVHAVFSWLTLRRFTNSSGLYHSPRELAGLMVEWGEHAPAKTGRHADAGVAAFAHEHEALRHDRRVAAGRSNRREVEAFERRVVADAVAIGDCPRDLTFIKVDRGQLRVRRL